MVFSLFGGTVICRSHFLLNFDVGSEHIGGSSRLVNLGVLNSWIAANIDYLLGRREVLIERVVLALSDPEKECAANQGVGRKACCVAPGFGASDCREGCQAHLWRVHQ